MRKKIIITIIFLSLAATGAFYAYDHYNAHPANLIRLHVIANSNTYYDQELKLKLKDRIVSEMTPTFSKATSAEEARQIANANVTKIKNIAQEEIHRQGFNYQVQVVRGIYHFPDKTYDIKNEDHITSLTLPSGRYEAVRVIIGSGQGANWWCVLYPPLCFVDLGQATPPTYLPSASAVKKKRNMDNQENLREYPHIEYRFRIADLFKTH